MLVTSRQRLSGRGKHTKSSPIGPALQLEGGSYSRGQQMFVKSKKKRKSRFRNLDSRLKRAGSGEIGGLGTRYPSKVREFFIDSFESHVMCVCGLKDGGDEGKEMEKKKRRDGLVKMAM